MRKMFYDTLFTEILPISAAIVLSTTTGNLAAGLMLMLGPALLLSAKPINYFFDIESKNKEILLNNHRVIAELSTFLAIFTLFYNMQINSGIKNPQKKLLGIAFPEFVGATGANVLLHHVTKPPAAVKLICDTIINLVSVSALILFGLVQYLTLHDQNSMPAQKTDARKIIFVVSAFLATTCYFLRGNFTDIYKRYFLEMTQNHPENENTAQNNTQTNALVV